MSRWMILIALAALLAQAGCGLADDATAVPETVVVAQEAQPPTPAPSPTPSPTVATATATQLSPTPKQAPATAAPAKTPTPLPPPTTPIPAQPQVEVVASGLSIPWALAFAPNGDIYVTERAGRLRIIADGVLRPEPVGTLAVEAIGEGGLMGLVLDPAFARNGWLYLMYTYTEGGQLYNRISRLTLTDQGLTEERALVDRIPGARFHNGGRLAIGPDGKLYAGTGDALTPALAQDLASLAGKILRLNLDGTIPADNPFPDSPVYSLGHRNPQGLAFQPETGVLFAVEHGPSGEFGLCCRDEMNRIVPGGNYGWPYVSGDDIVDAAQAAAHDVIAPVSSSGLDTWAPGGIAFYQGGPLRDWQGDAFFGALRGRHLRRVVLGGAEMGQVVRQEPLFSSEFGRIRDVVMGPDGYLYLTTSNRDGRGEPAADDDRVLRIGVAD